MKKGKKYTCQTGGQPKGDLDTNFNLPVINNRKVYLDNAYNHYIGAPGSIPLPNNYVTYPGDTLSNNQIPAATNQIIQTPHGIREGGFGFEVNPYAPNEVTAGLRNLNPLNYKLNPKDIAKINHELSSYLFGIVKGKSGSNYLPSPKKKAGGKAQAGLENSYDWQNFGDPTPQRPQSTDLTALMQMDGDQRTQQGPVVPGTPEYKGNGNYFYHPYAQAFNLLSMLTTGFANQINNVRDARQENNQWMEALSRPSYNFNEEGNDVPNMYKAGGLTKDEAYAILKQGSVKGHPLSRQQKILFRRFAKTGHMPAPGSIHEAGGCTDCGAPLVFANGGWIQGAIKHPGRCAHPGDSNCPQGSPQYNLAMRFKHGDLHHHQAGGPVEAEEGEVYQTNQGDMSKVPEGSGTHEEGGVMVNNAQRILEDTSDKRSDKASKLLKLQPKDVKELTGYEPNKAMTHSKAMEFASSKLATEENRFYAKINKNVESLAQNKTNKFADNSLKFNMMNLSGKPQQQQIFDNLFQHQEAVKAQAGIQNDGQMAQFGTYNGGRTHGGRYTPTGQDNAFSFKGGLDEFKKQWAPYLDLNKYKTAAEAQGAVYDYVLQNAPQAIEGMWKSYGNTAQGLKQGILKDRYSNGNFTNGSLSTDDLQKLKGAYVDNMFGVRTLLPGMITPPAEAPAPAPQQPQQPYFPPRDTPPNFNFQNPKSTFNEPLHWYDVAGPLQGILEGRTPAKYNPVEYQKLRMHQLNPLPTLQSAQRDYNAVLGQLPQNGQGYANAANIFSQKYSMDNQVLGQYENMNKQILDKQDAYNAQVSDNQANADQRSRAVFQDQVLGSKEALRQQHMQSWDDLYTRLAENRKLNREGNLLMKMFPAFDQNAEYNGYKVQFRPPVTMPLQTNVPTNILQPTSKEAPTGKRYITLNNGTKYYF